MKNLITFLLALTFSFELLSQNSFTKHLRLDVNLNSANKKRSYSVYSGNKYANSGYLMGIDLGMYYQSKKFDAGIELYPYQHINVFAGYNLLNSAKARITPNFKFGYSPLLHKIYYGGGFKISYGWFNFSYSKLLHIKYGNSKYHGDGLTCYSFGLTFKIPQNIGLFSFKKSQLTSNNFSTTLV